MDKKVYYWLAAAGWLVAVFCGGSALEIAPEPDNGQPVAKMLAMFAFLLIAAFGAAAGVVFMRLYRQKSEQDRQTNKGRVDRPQPPDARRF